MSERSSEESFFREHSKEFVISGAIGAMGLIFALTARRLRAQDLAAEANNLEDGESEDSSENL